MNKLIATTEQEFTILQYHEVDRKIKALEKERNSYKEIITKRYMEDYEIAVSSSGILLATYARQLRTQFDTTRFKQDFPTTYEKYCEKKEIRSLLIK